MKKLLFALCMIIAVGLIAFGVYNLNNSDKAVFARAFEKSMSKMMATNERESVLSSSSFNSITKFVMDMDVKAVVGKDKSQIKGSIYGNQESMYLNLDFLENSKVINGYEVLFNDTKFYFKVKDVFKNYYYTELEQSNQTYELTEEDKELLNKLSSYMTEAITDNMANKDFEGTEEEISLGGKNYSTKVISLDMTEKKLADIMLSLLNKMKSDEKMMNILTSAGISKETIEESHKELKESAKTAEDKTKLLTYTVYIYDGEILTHKFSVPIKSGDTTVPIILKISAYKNDSGYTNFETSVIAGIELFNLKLVGTSATKTTITSSIYQMLDITGEYETSTTKDSLTLTGYLTSLTGDEEKTEVFNLAYLVEEIVKSEEYKMTINANIISDDKATITGEYTIKAGVEMPTIDISNALPSDKMTDKEKAFIEGIFDMFTSVSSALDI